MQMGSLCMVLPGRNSTDYFVHSRLVKGRAVKSRNGTIRDAAFFISGISGGGVTIIVVQEYLSLLEPNHGLAINVFLQRCPWADLG